MIPKRLEQHGIVEWKGMKEKESKQYHGCLTNLRYLIGVYEK